MQLPSVCFHDSFSGQSRSRIPVGSKLEADLASVTAVGLYACVALWPALSRMCRYAR
jgi:hypothetical protein